MSGSMLQVWLVIYMTPFCIASLICSTILQARTSQCCKLRSWHLQTQIQGLLYKKRPVMLLAFFFAQPSGRRAK